MSSVGRIFDGVGDDVHHHLEHPLPVSHNGGQIGLQTQLHLVVVALGLHVHGVVQILYRHIEGEAHQMQFVLSRVEPGQGEQILHDMGHAVALVENDPQKLFFCGGR